MKKLLAKLWASILKRLPWIGEPEPEPDVMADALDLSTVDWNGSNYSGAPITTLMRSARLDDRLHYDFDVPETWPVKTYNGKPCVAMLCIFYELDGKIVGGKMDHSKPGQSSQDLKNTRNNYNNLKPIPAASKAWMCAVAEDGSERSNVARCER